MKNASFNNKKIPYCQIINRNKNNKIKPKNVSLSPIIQKKNIEQNFQNKHIDFSKSNILPSFQIEPQFNESNSIYQGNLSNYSTIPYSLRNFQLNLNPAMRNTINSRTPKNSNNNDHNYYNANSQYKRDITPNKILFGPNISNTGNISCDEYCIDKSISERNYVKNNNFINSNYENFDNLKYIKKIQDLENSLDLYKKSLSNLLKNKEKEGYPNYNQNLSPQNYRGDDNSYEGSVHNINTNHLINLTIENMELKIKLYEKENEDMKKERNNLIEQINNYQMENEGLKNKIKDLEKKNKNYIANKNKKLQELNNLKNELKKKDEEINNLKENIKTLNTDFNSYKNNNQLLIDELKGEKKGLLNKIVDLQTTILNKDAQIKELNKELKKDYPYMRHSSNECNVIVNSFNISQNLSVDQLQLSSRQDPVLQERFDRIKEQCQDVNSEEKSLKKDLSK